MTEEHKKRHEELHKCLDELVADYVFNTKALPSKTNLIIFMDWAWQQTIKPTGVK